MFQTGSKALACVMAMGVMVAMATDASAADAQLPAPMVAPPPPRMLDPATATLEDEATQPAASLRQHCLALLDRINALPAGPQWSQGSGTVTSADGSTHATLERAPERKRLEQAYRQECAQEKR